MTLSIFMGINVISLCLVGLSLDGSPGLQEGPKIRSFQKCFSPAMANPNRLEGHIFEKSPFWGPKFGFFLKI